jgi:hypothetical protein
MYTKLQVVLYKEKQLITWGLFPLPGSKGDDVRIKRKRVCVKCKTTKYHKVFRVYHQIKGRWTVKGLAVACPCGHHTAYGIIAGGKDG